MTNKELYILLEPIAVKFSEDAENSKDSEIHAANSILCLLMGGLQAATEGRKNVLYIAAMSMAQFYMNLAETPVKKES